MSITADKTNPKNQDIVIFPVKNIIPADDSLREAIGKSLPLWNEIKEYILKKNSDAEDLWNYSGKTYGWGFRIKDKKRVIVYMMPYSDFFKVSFVFGENATKVSLNSNISGEIKKIISSAKVYSEGRGFRIEMKSKSMLGDIKKLIDIKLSN